MAQALLFGQIRFQYGTVSIDIPCGLAKLRLSVTYEHRHLHAWRRRRRHRLPSVQEEGTMATRCQSGSPTDAADCARARI